MVIFALQNSIVFDLNFHNQKNIRSGIITRALLANDL